MTFTDDDKEKLAFSLQTFYTPTINPKILESLLLRLEAAEDCIGYTHRHSEWEDRYNTWRKAAGK